MQDGNISIHVGNLSRKRDDGSQRSAVERASYNSGKKLWSKRLNKQCNFDHRNDVAYTAIFAPEGAPGWALDREQLWNQVDTSAKRKDSRLAKTITGSIARQIPPEDRKEMLARLADAFVAIGCVVDVAIHEDGTNHNPHIHIMLTVNTLLEDGFGKKLPGIEERKFVTTVRPAWAALSNHYLKKNGSSLTVDHRSYKKRCIGLEPTRHRGPNKQERQAKRERAREVHSSQIRPEPEMQAPIAANAAVPAFAPTETEEQIMRQPTEAERREYPHLTRRDHWPPQLEPTADMDRATRSELRRYWDDHQIEKMEAERLLEAATPEHQYQDLPEPVFEQTPEAQVHSNLDYGRDLVFEAEYKNAIAERSKTLVNEATNLQRGVLGYTREEKQLLDAARNATPEEAKVIRDYVIFKRMELIQERERQQLQKEIAKWEHPKHIALIKERIEAAEQEALQMAHAERQAVQPETGFHDYAHEIVQGPNDEPLHPRERDLAQERMIDDMQQEIEKLPEQHLGDHIDHAHAARKMIKDLEKHPNEDYLNRLREHEQERERER